MTLRTKKELSNLIVYPESNRIMYVNDPARGKIPVWKHTNDGWKLNVYNANENVLGEPPELYLGNGAVRMGTFKNGGTTYTFNMETATLDEDKFQWDPELEVYKRSLGGVDRYLYVKAMKDGFFLYAGTDLAAMDGPAPVTKTKTS